MIYFIHNVRGNAIKIGHSADPAGRLRALRTANPDRLDLLGVIPGGSSGEAELHALFSDFRTQGEWFRVDPLLFSSVLSIIRRGSIPREDRAEDLEWLADFYRKCALREGDSIEFLLAEYRRRYGKKATRQLRLNLNWPEPAPAGV